MIKLTLKELDKIIEDEISKILLEKKDYNIKVETIDGELIDLDELDSTKDWKAKENKKRAISGFQAYYRTLNHNQAYELRNWLTKTLLDDLSLSQIEEITSRVISASKGLTDPIDKNKKPK